MTDTKQKKSEILLETLGEVSDRYLAEYMEFSDRVAEKQGKTRKKTVIWSGMPRDAKIALPIAAAFLVLVIGAGSLLYPMLHMGASQKASTDEHYRDGADMNREAEYYNIESGDGSAPKSTSTNTLADAAYERTLSAGSTVTGDGNVYLAWQTEENGFIYISSALDTQSANALYEEIEKGAAATEESETSVQTLWIIGDDGTVLSPYRFSGETDGSFVRYDTAERIPTDVFWWMVRAQLGIDG